MYFTSTSRLPAIIRRWRLLVHDWTAQTLYQRFESVVALVLTLLITLIIIVALYRLVIGVGGNLVLGASDPLNHEVFQKVFGEIMTLLIALEFNHTLEYVATRQQTIIQTQVVLLIAVLALARKFIILDMATTSPTMLAGLAMVTLALGVTYWLMRDRHGGAGAVRPFAPKHNRH